MASETAPECPLVCIWWEDSRQPDGRWRRLTDLPSAEPVICASVGWLVHDGPRVKQVAPNLGDAHCEVNIQASGIMSIAASSVLRIDRLKEPRAPKRVKAPATIP